MKQLLSTLFMVVLACAAQAQAPAFPGAEGHGRYITGGRGGEVRHVTTLVDDGNNTTQGTLRWAVSGSAKKMVVFDVGGIIALTKELVIGDNTTIEGQTAPSPGITLRYYTVRPGNNNIIRFVRFRRGEEVDVNDGADATWQRNKDGILLDHCSFSWSIDELASFYDNTRFTMQWCTLGEALANPGHSKGEHSYGGIWGGKGASFHHNFLCHVQNRAPRFCGARYAWEGYDQTKFGSPVEAEIVDFRNCVMYNWGNGNGCYGGTGGGNINIVNNYYKAGPATANKTRVTQISVATSDNASGSPYMGYCSRYFISGNYVAAASVPQNYDWSGVIYDSGTYTINGERYCADAQHLYGADVTYVKNNNTDCVKIKLDKAVDAGEVTTHTAQNAFEKVLAYGGASLHRDGVDARYMEEARTGTTHYTGSATKTGDGKTIKHLPGIIDFVRDQGAYELASTSRPEGFDTDEDGIPDAWETANGLDPSNKTDAQLYTLDPKKYYTNLEVYANSLVQDIMLGGNAQAQEGVAEYYPAYTKEDGTVVESVVTADETTDDPVDISNGVEGTISWPMNEGVEQPSYVCSSTIGDYLQTVNVTIGSHLVCHGMQKAGIEMTTYTISDETSDNSATQSNAVQFNVVPADGYLFQPTHVSFKATRFGTDHGKFQAYWLNADGSRIEIAQEQLANRNNATPAYTTIDEDINGKAVAEGGSLVIHLYDIPYNTNTKTMGLADVVVTGKVGTAASEGVSSQVTDRVVRSVYSNLNGQRVSHPAHGAFVRTDYLHDGSAISRKVVIR